MARQAGAELRASEMRGRKQHTCEGFIFLPRSAGVPEQVVCPVRHLGTAPSESKARVRLWLSLATPVGFTALAANSREMVYLFFLTSLALMGSNSPEVNGIAVV